ncbi:MAG: dihydrodipicolinate synthase family protein [Haloarculaceae archaeon]
MDVPALRSALADVAFTTPTPFTADGESVDAAAVASNAERLSAAGARLFVPCGNTGEYYALTDDERVTAVESTAGAVDADAAVVAGAGGNVATVCSLADTYRDAGADAVMVMHPSHPYKHERGLETYYRRIADRSALPVVVYKRGDDLPASVVAAVSTHENVVGVKWADGDLAAFAGAVADGGEVTWINGIAERYAPAFAAEGASGFTTGIGNVLPDATLALRDALADGEWARARRIRDLLRPLEDLRAESGPDGDLAAANNVPVVKEGLDYVGAAGGPVRPPLVGLAPADRERLEDGIDAVRDASL